MEEPSKSHPRRRAVGYRTREAILETAAQLASVEGLEGLSIGRLADAVGMSKSGLYAHFRSKLELQLATIATADDVFGHEVIELAQAAPPGTARVLALCDAFLSHVERGVFPGGCFFVAATAEMNVRPGPLRDRIADFVTGWMQAMGTAIHEAQTQGEIRAELDAVQLAFETNALLVAANLAFPLSATQQCSNGHASECSSGYARPPQTSNASKPNKPDPVESTPSRTSVPE